MKSGNLLGKGSRRLKGKLLARLKEDGETLVVKIDFDTQEILMQADPETFFLTDHYVGWPTILVRLARVDRDDLARLLEDSWRQNAPKRLRDRFP